MGTNDETSLGDEEKFGVELLGSGGGERDIGSGAPVLLGRKGEWHEKNEIWWCTS